jgi:hypothetical protein
MNVIAFRQNLLATTDAHELGTHGFGAVCIRGRQNGYEKKHSCQERLPEDFATKGILQLETPL